MSGSVNHWSRNGFGEFIPRAKDNGKFSKEDSEKVRQAVKKYCDKRSITTTLLCSECDHKADFKGAWMEIAQDLPHRSVQSVYRHALRTLHSFKRGAWTESEISLLTELVEKYGKKWTKIQQDLRRSADACRDKYRELNQQFIKGRWNEEDTERLKTLIRRHLRVGPRTTMLEVGKIVEAEGLSLPWVAISKAMGNRSRLSCFKKFQKMTGLFSPSDEGKKAIQPEGYLRAARGHKLAVPAAVENEIREALQQADDEHIPARGFDGHDDDDDDDDDEHVLPTDEIVLQDEDVMGDEDMVLLAELANSGALRTSDVVWETLHVDGALDRWNAIVSEWRQQEGAAIAEEILAQETFSELAQRLLDRKASAKLAAATVDAVDMPELP